MNLETELRRAVLPAMKNSAPLTDIVPRNQIWPKTTPAAPVWPFTRYGASTAIPITASCVNGEDIAFTIHAFAKPRMSGTSLLETAEDHAERIAGAIKGALHKLRVVTTAGLNIRIRMTSKQVVQDGAEADAYHAIVQFRGKVLAE
ncbi:DUF3168 domain-containing protein [Sphingomonas sp. PB4P5]|uniref:DUF3168 domain-containing protein n=1 Tax=Parasphingomonas puruogangriensis TaxID=3096155 RepID=UPI002FCC4D3D